MRSLDCFQAWIMTCETPESGAQHYPEGEYESTSQESHAGAGGYFINTGTLALYYQTMMESNIFRNG